MTIKLEKVRDTKNFALFTLPAGYKGAGMGGLYFDPDTIEVEIKVTKGARQAPRAVA